MVRKKANQLILSVFLTPILISLKPKKLVDFVLPKGFEPLSSVPETEILSIELREPVSVAASPSTRVQI